MLSTTTKHPHAPHGIRSTARHRERPVAGDRPTDGEVRALAAQILARLEESQDLVRVALGERECMLPSADLRADGGIDQISRAHWVAARMLEVQRMSSDGAVDVDRVLRETTRLGTYPNYPGKPGNDIPATVISDYEKWMRNYPSVDGTVW